MTDAGGLGLLLRSLVGLDCSAALDAFAAFLDDSRYTADQIRFVTMMIDELTATGVMEPGRLFESPYTDNHPHGPDAIFPETDITLLIDTLTDIRRHALPEDAATA